jgi:hypothetical protein
LSLVQGCERQAADQSQYRAQERSGAQEAARDRKAEEGGYA